MKQRRTHSRGTQPATAPTSPPPQITPAVAAPGSAGLWLELRWLLPALLLAFVVFANSLQGEFVYDDQRQIVRNTLIQQPDLLWRALTSDVWAFMGGDAAASNYWRPTFVAYLALGVHGFGMDTFGWHLSNVLLHMLVTALAFALVRRLHASLPVAAAVALLFAVHPVHSESVAWISGVPDLLLAASLLGSLLLVSRLREQPGLLRLGLALLLYALALGAKEIALLFPLIVVALDWRGRLRDAMTRVWPFVVLALLYLLARHWVLGSWQQLPANPPSLLETLLTLPATFVFYLRQLVFPWWIGPSYPLRIVEAGQIGWSNVFWPLLLSLAVLGWMLLQARKSVLARVGLALFLLPLLPAMNLAAFHPEQLVHDRYLYLPSLGFLMLLVPALHALLQSLAGADRAQAWLRTCVALAALPLALQTISYNRAWGSNLELWQWAVRSDPSSAFNHHQLGVHLQQARRTDEAVAALDRSIALQPTLAAHLARGIAHMGQGRFDQAERDLRQITGSRQSAIAPYLLYQAYEALAVSLNQQRLQDQAGQVLREARTRLPTYQATLTEKLAVVLYQSGQKATALQELMDAQSAARSEALPEARLVFFRLGLLHTESGNLTAARAAYQEFLDLTRSMITPGIQQARAMATAHLSRLEAAPPAP